MTGKYKRHEREGVEDGEIQSVLYSVVDSPNAYCVWDRAWSKLTPPWGPGAQLLGSSPDTFHGVNYPNPNITSDDETPTQAAVHGTWASKWQRPSRSGSLHFCVCGRVPTTRQMFFLCFEVMESVYQWLHEHSCGLVFRAWSMVIVEKRNYNKI